MPTKERHKTTIPRAVINRMSRYHFYINDLIEKGVERISSRELSKMIGITASQLRQDLNYFGGFGQRGYGYNVKDLNEKIEEIMGLHQAQTMVIIGAGNIGQALCQYRSFEAKGFHIKAMFDVNPKLIGLKFNNVPVLDLEEAVDFIQENKIDIGVIAVPKEAAQKVADMLVQGGVKGIWNFAPVEIKTGGKVVVEHQNLMGSLLILSFRILSREAKN
jgi:redox-sensing transcriptional repressor